VGTAAVALVIALARCALAGLTLVAGIATSHAHTAAAKAGAAATQSIHVPGLKEPAEILIDRWGVPHIYAKNEDDAYFAQGFNAARDRLFQIDLWRRRGLGELSSIFGAQFVEQDRAARLFLFRGDLTTEWQSYGQAGQRIATRFVAGINAYIDSIANDSNKLPFEFRRFNYTPEKWQPEDVVRIRSHVLSQNLMSEVSRSIVACHADLKSDEIRVQLSPPWKTKIPDGLDPCIPGEVLQTYVLGTQGVAIGERSAQNYTAPSAVVRAQGSNAWAIAPSRTATGRTILASDPHRAYSTPSLRYIVHLSARDLNVIGAGEPALPGISIGHNDNIAFGLTIFSMDQEDLYVYELNPANPLQYKYQGHWETMRALTTTIAVRGAAPANLQLLYTRHGPILYIDKDKRRAFALRAAWLDPGMAPYFGSIEYMYAKNFADFRSSLAHWGAPAENQIYADNKGNIGWVVAGRSPLRPNWDGLLPVPGDGRYEWAGFVAGDALPWSYNPPQGWIASSNEMNIPADYPYWRTKLGFEWPDNSRYVRAGEWLSEAAGSSLEDSMRMQNDLLSIPARRLVALLKPLESNDGPTRAALKMLVDWDCVESGDSAAAALFEVWWSRYLGAAFSRAVLGRQAAFMIPQPDVGVLLDTLESPAPLLGAHGTAKRDEILLGSLKLAYQESQLLLGPDAGQWHWGTLHFSLQEHPLANATDDATRALLNVGPFPKGGGGTTLNVSEYGPASFQTLNGPSFRMVVDVGHWDNSRAINSPGQSGDPQSPHYRDLAPMWLKGEYFPLLYSRKAVEAATVTRLDLKPAQ
jgi:penicillin amidase